MRQYIDILNENDAELLQRLKQHLIDGGIDPEQVDNFIKRMSPNKREEYFVKAGLLPSRADRMAMDRFPKPAKPDPELDALFQSKDNNTMTKDNLNEEISISGSADELLQLMKLAGASDAGEVTSNTISQGPELSPCPSCGKMHDAQSGGCGSDNSEMDMGDYIRMISTEEDDVDGDFTDASTEPDEKYMNDVSASIPNGNDLNREKGSHAPTNGGDNPMALEDQIRSSLAKALEEKKNKNSTCKECGNPSWRTLSDSELEEAHGNDKIYDKCWKGYEKVPGKKRGEEGSCRKK